MRIGIIGSGNIGATLARLWVGAGHQVVLSYARDADRLRELAQSLGPSASVATPAQAAAAGDVVVLSVPWPQVDDALAAAGAEDGALDGRVLVDTCNPFASPGGPLDLPAGATSAGLEVARQAPGARAVKAFNTLYFVTLGERAGAGASATDGDPLAMPMSGDDRGAKELVAGLVRDAGYEPVDIGSLGGATRQEPGGPVYGEELTATQARDRLRELEATNLALGRRFVTEVLGAQDRAAFAELVDPEVVVHSGMSPLAPMVGRDAFAAGLVSLAAFAFVDFTLEDLLAVEDRVIARYRAHADHTGDQLGVPATGKRVTMWETRLMRWRAGRLVEDFVADINYDWPWLVAPAYPDGIGRTGNG